MSKLQWSKKMRSQPRRRAAVAVAVAAALAATVGPASAVAVQPPWLRDTPVDAERGDAPIVLGQWRVAENRATCAPLMFKSVLLQREIPVARGAYFGGGWGVAYDTPTMRSAFGVAGAGLVVEDRDLRAWKRSIRWSDGSAVTYGLVANTGPGYLAYLRVAGQQCLYNVWSDIGVTHLRALIRQLRLVEVAPKPRRS
jgi:hypothetical protein